MVTPSDLEMTSSSAQTNKPQHNPLEILSFPLFGCAFL